MGKTCCFIGHRDAPESICPSLCAEVERHITNLGVTSFLVGDCGAFDRMAARAVREIQADYPSVTLSLVLAYLPAPGHAAERDGYDDSIYPEGLECVPRRFAISHRNRYMVDCSDFLIAYVTHGWGGAAQTLKYAQTRHKQIVHLNAVRLLKFVL